MTGRLRRLTGPALIADHDKRIDQLERRLNTSQTDPGRTLRPRPGGGSAGPSFGWWNDADGAVSGGYLVFNQQYTLGDTTWFEFPGSWMSVGNDRTSIRILKPGFIIATWHGSSGASLAADIEATWGFARFAHGEGAEFTMAGAAVLLSSDMTGDPHIRLPVSGGSGGKYGQLSLQFTPGESVFTAF